MYEIYVGVGNGHYDLLYEDTSMAPSLGLIDPVLTLEESKAGNFTTTIPISHPLYSTIQKRITEFRVYRSGDLLWKGCLLSDDLDFFKQRKLVVEGPLGFLNDTMQIDTEYEIESDNDIRTYVSDALDRHNYKVDTPHKIYLGDVSIKRNQSVRKLIPNLQPTKLTLTRETSTKQAMDNLLSTYGGYFEITYTYDHSEPGYDGYPIPVLNYRQDFIEIVGGQVVETTDRVNSSQTIIFGQNLMDFTKTVSMNDIATVIVPLGANDEDGNPITIASVNSGRDYIYVSQDIFNRYGWIEKVVRWSDIDEPGTLKGLAQEYATNLQFFEAGTLDIGTMTISITALDMKYLNANADAINLSEKVRVYSEYHNTNQYYPCQKMEIHMANPESTMIFLGRSVTGNDDTLSTRLSNIDKDKDTTDTTDYSSEIADLTNDLSDITDWAETMGYNPDLSTDGYISGLVSSGWMISSSAWSVLSGLSKDDGNIKKVFATPPLWVYGYGDVNTIPIACGRYIFNSNTRALTPSFINIHAPVYQVAVAGYWVAGLLEMRPG